MFANEKGELAAIGNQDLVGDMFGIFLDITKANLIKVIS